MLACSMYYLHLLVTKQETDILSFIIIFCLAITLNFYLFYSFITKFQYSFEVTDDCLILHSLFGGKHEWPLKRMQKIKIIGFNYREIYLYNSSKTIVVHDGLENVSQLYELLDSKIAKNSSIELS